MYMFGEIGDINLSEDKELSIFLITNNKPNNRPNKKPNNNGPNNRDNRTPT